MSVSQINSVEMVNAHLTDVNVRTINDGLKSLPNIDSLSIKSSTVHILPHILCVRSLKVHPITPGCEDWVWLQDVTRLQELEVSFCAAEI